MKKQLLIKTILFSLLSINMTFAQVPDSCTYVQNDNIINVEMESGNLNGGFWVYQNDKPGFSGTGFIQYIGGDATGVPGKSQLTYTFKVTTPGRHSFKLTAFRDNYHDNDVWVRFPQGGVMTKIGNDSTGTMGSNWFKAVIGTRDEWYSFIKTQHLGTAWGEQFHDVYVDFPTAGVYTVQFSGRASMFRLDRFTLYTQRSLTQALAKPESPKENCFPYNMTGKVFLADPIEDITIESGQPWSFTIPAGTFGGGTSIGYSSYLGTMAALPTWITFNQATGTFTANPAFENGGKYSILVKAEDNGTHAVDAFDLTVNGNRPPAMVVTLRDTTAIAGEAFVYDMGPNITDADGHTLSYLVRSGSGAIPAWLSFNGTTLSGTPQTSDIGNDTIYVTVTDAFGGSMFESFIIKTRSIVIQGVNKGIEKMNVSMYPNPAEEIINIRTGGYGKGSVVLTDNVGRTYYSFENLDLGKELTLDLASMNLQPGLYILRIKSNDKAREYNGLVIKK